MEVEVVAVHGVPEDAIISIRAGASRRQAPVSALGANGQPFKFSSGPAGCNPFKLDVLQPVGSARMALKPAGGTYTIPIKSNSTPGVTVQLNVKAGNGADNKKDLASDLFDRIDADRDGIISRREFTNIVKRGDDEKIVLQPVDEGEDVGVTPVGSSKLPPLPKDDDGRFPPAAAVAKEYLDKHKLLPFVRALLQSVVRERPDDPFSFIAEQFRSLCDDTGASPPPPRPARAQDFQGGEDSIVVAKELPPAPPSFPKNDGGDPPSIEVAKQLPAEITDAPTPPTFPKDNGEDPPSVEVAKQLPTETLDVSSPFSMKPSTGTWLMRSPRPPQSPQSPSEVMLSPANEPMVPAVGSQPFNTLPSAAPFVHSPSPAVESTEDQAKEKAREALESALLGSEFNEEESKAKARDALESAFFPSELTEEESKAKAVEAIEVALIGSSSSERAFLGAVRVREEETKARARDALESALFGSDFAGEETKAKARDALANALLEDLPKSVSPHPAVHSLLHSLAADMGHDFSKLSPEQMDIVNAKAQKVLSSLVQETVNGPLSTKNPEEELDDAKSKARDALSAALMDDDDEELESAKAKARSALSTAFLIESEDEVQSAKAKARTALTMALMEDTEEDMEHAKSKARSALVSVLQNDGEMQDAKEKARVALAAALMGDHDEVELAKTKARDALAAALMDDEDDVETAKQKARAALTAALMDDDDEKEEMEDAKENARMALFSILGGSQEEEMADAKEKARLALAVALMGDEDDVESAKEKARTSLTAALMDDEEHVEHAKQKARAALGAALMDDDETGNVENAKEKARAALASSLMDDEDDIADAKQKARDALSAAFMNEDDEVELAKEKARDALSSALMDEEDEVESAKATARAALSKVLDVDDVDEKHLVEEAKEKARIALQTALVEDAEESPTHEANMERAKDRARKSLTRSLMGDEETAKEAPKEKTPNATQADLSSKLARLSKASLDGSLSEKLQEAPLVAEATATTQAPPPVPEVARPEVVVQETAPAKLVPPREHGKRQPRPHASSTERIESSTQRTEAGLTKKVGTSLAQASLDGSMAEKMQDDNLKRTLLEAKERLTRSNLALRGEVETMNDGLRTLFQELRELKDHVKK